MALVCPSKPEVVQLVVDVVFVRETPSTALVATLPEDDSHREHDVDDEDEDDEHLRARAHDQLRLSEVAR